MTRHDPLVRLRHTCDSAREPVGMPLNRTRQDLESDWQFNLALERLLEIVGEVAVPRDLFAAILDRIQRFGVPSPLIRRG